MSLAHNSLWGVLEQEKAKIRFSLPCKLDRLLVPLLRFQMDWQIRHAFATYRIIQELGNHRLTFRAALEVSSYLYRLSKGLRHQGYKNFLRALTMTDFLGLLHRYGDSFTATMLLIVKDNNLDIQEASVLPIHLQEVCNLYQAKKFQEVYGAISQKWINTKDTKQQDKVRTNLLIIFDCLISHHGLLEQYLDFFLKIAGEPTIIKSLETIALISHNVGTRKAYETFLAFSKKFCQRPQFEQLVKLADMIANTQNPELFQQTFSWASSSALPPETIEKALVYSQILLTENPDNPNYPIFSFQKFLQYIKPRENHFQKMTPEEIDYYLKKAVECLVV